MEMFFSRIDVAKRWGCSVRKIDRLRMLGLLPWLDLTAGLGKKPLVRIRRADVVLFEEDNYMDLKNKIKEKVNGN